MLYGSEYEDHGLVFAQPNGRCMDPKNLTSREYKRLARDAKLRYINFHGLRHTHATDLIRRGYHPHVISRRLGHSSIAVTMDIYGHLFPEMQSPAGEAIDDLLPLTEPDVAVQEGTQR